MSPAPASGTQRIAERARAAGRPRSRALRRVRRSLPVDHRSAAAERAPPARQGSTRRADGLGRLSWMYLRLLLVAQHVIDARRRRARHETGDLTERLAEPRTAREGRGARRGSAPQPDRAGRDPAAAHRPARRSRSASSTYIDAELTRIEQQVELIREQAALSTDPEAAVATDRRDHRDARRHRRSGFAISSRSTARWRILLSDAPPMHGRRRSGEGESMSAELPAGPWRCATCSGPARPPSSSCTATSSTSSRRTDQLLSLAAFLDEVMFANYDVVLHYDRSRGVRATKGGDDWGEWLPPALGARPSRWRFSAIPARRSSWSIAICCAR